LRLVKKTNNTFWDSIDKPGLLEPKIWWEMSNRHQTEMDEWF